MRKVCNTPECQKSAAKNRADCHSCKQRKYKEKNPLQYAYQQLRGRAKKRGKEFTITFEYFKEFCIKTSYMEKKGIYKDSYHIDRKREWEGYVPGNLQVLTNSDNIKKFLHYDYHNGKFSTVTKRISDDNERYKDVPF